MKNTFFSGCKPEAGRGLEPGGWVEKDLGGFLGRLEQEVVSPGQVSQTSSPLATLATLGLWCQGTCRSAMFGCSRYGQRAPTLVVIALDQSGRHFGTGSFARCSASEGGGGGTTVATALDAIAVFVNIILRGACSISAHQPLVFKMPRS
jgi:hypothetical protein